MVVETRRIRKKRIPQKKVEKKNANNEEESRDGDSDTYVDGGEDPLNHST